MNENKKPRYQNMAWGDSTSRRKFRAVIHTSKRRKFSNQYPNLTSMELKKKKANRRKIIKINEIKIENRINNIKSWLFVKAKTTDKILVRLGQKTQINKIINDRGFY